MKVIGLTGPSGAGKTVVAAFFDWPSVNADQIARRIHRDPVVQKALCDRFGADIMGGNGIDRTLLAHRAFANREATDDLNAIMHPRIVEEIARCLKEQEALGAKFCLLDAPLLFEAGCYDLCDTAVAVLAEDDVRRSRIEERDGITDEQARRRMNSQPREDYYLDRCRYVIRNNGDICRLQQSVKELKKTLEEELGG